MIPNSSNLLMVDKPKHWTSNDVVRKIKKELKIKKVGHAGTLDPLASGLMILGINEGTKLLHSLLLSTKTYVATLHFNYHTDTYDSEGEIVNYEFKQIDLTQITAALDFFKNHDYYQLPPKHSAIKINGHKAYELARKNVNFNLSPKLVKLLNYKIVSYIDKELVVELEVSKGFYIRSFAYDLGKQVGNYANLANLVRTKIGSYKLEDASKLKELHALLLD